MNLTSSYSTEKIEPLLEENLMKVICHSHSFQDCRKEVVVLVSGDGLTSIDVGSFIFYDDRVNSSSSVQLIGNVLSVFISSRFGTSAGGFWYMQDNTSPQVSGFAKNFLRKKQNSYSRMVAYPVLILILLRIYRYDRQLASNYASKESNGARTNN